MPQFSAEQIITTLARMEPWCSGNESWPYCFFCGLDQDEATTQGAKHDPTCIWQQARNLCEPLK